MKVHLHTVCWNDRIMLDYFFRHYHWVDRFFLDDDSSTDDTLDYLQSRPDVTVRRLHRANPDSWVDSARQIYDSAWKRSRGAADWVVVSNIDEHIQHPDMRRYLAANLAVGVTVIPALGYQMVSEDFPAPDAVLWRDHPNGAPWAMMSKCGIFRPDSIAETHYAPGRHQAAFVGEVVYPDKDDVANLHYKYLGVGRTHERQAAQNQRLGEGDRAGGWGHEYAWTRERLDAAFDGFRARLVDTTRIDHHRDHHERRWWRPRPADRFFADQPARAQWWLGDDNPDLRGDGVRLHPVDVIPVFGAGFIELPGGERRGGLHLPVLDSAAWTLSLVLRYAPERAACAIAGTLKPGPSEGGLLLGGMAGAFKLKVKATGGQKRLTVPVGVAPGDWLFLSLTRAADTAEAGLWLEDGATFATLPSDGAVGDLVLGVGNYAQATYRFPDGLDLAWVGYTDQALSHEDLRQQRGEVVADLQARGIVCR